MMLRAISEIASAISVWSVLVNPTLAASSRAFWRAVTISVSCAIAICASSTTVTAQPRDAPQMSHAFLEVERRGDAVERQAQLYHRERDIGLDPDDHGVRAAKPGGVRDRAQRAGRERIEDVERHDVDH